MSLLFDDYLDITEPTKELAEQLSIMKELAGGISKSLLFLNKLKEELMKKDISDMNIHYIKKVVFVEEELSQKLKKMSEKSIKNQREIVGDSEKAIPVGRNLRRIFEKHELLLREIKDLISSCNLIFTDFKEVDLEDIKTAAEEAASQAQSRKEIAEAIYKINDLFSAITSLSKKVNDELIYLKAERAELKKKDASILIEIYKKAVPGKKYFKKEGGATNEELSEYYFEITGDQKKEIERAVDVIRSVSPDKVKGWRVAWRRWHRRVQEFEVDVGTMLKKPHIHLDLEVPGYSELKKIHLVAA